MAKKSFVYYDSKYHIDKPNSIGSWLTLELSNKIAQSLEAKRFKRLNATELREVMLAVVKRENTEIVVQEKKIVIKKDDIVVIVFAQDVAPDTVLDHDSPTALVRQYLDCGGSIVWIGDIPFYYQAQENGYNDWEKSGAPANILGVNPIFPTQISRVKITKAGEVLGLKSKWTGIRPILIDKTIKVLAEGESLISAPYQAIPSSRLSRLWNKVAGISIGAGTVQLGVAVAASNKEELSQKALINKTLANAWFKNYNADREHSGFFRIWDYNPAVLSKQQYKELCHLATYAGGN